MEKKLQAVILIALIIFLSATLYIIVEAREKYAYDLITPSPTQNPTPEPVDYSYETAHLSVSEIMVKNQAVPLGESGSTADWVELYNTSDSDIDLSGWSFSDGKNSFTFSDRTIAVDERLPVFFGDGNNALQASFGISETDSLRLLDPNGDTAWHLDTLKCSANKSLISEEGVEYSETAWVTPGYANTAEGYEQYMENAPAVKGPLIINEAVAANNTYEPFKGSGYCDWIEIKNISDKDVDLSSYYLSDKNKNKLLSTFSTAILAPNEIILICCTESECPAGFGSVSFSLSTPDESLWLTEANGEVIDEMYLHDIPVNGSCGRLPNRNGFFYFEQPTPGDDNTEGYRRVTAQPQASVPSMAYDNVDSLSIELKTENEAQIYYTTDSSTPIAGVSQRYTEPIQISETTIIRAIAVEENAYPSKPVTFSYILNQDRTLPILSLVIENSQAFFNNYWNQIKAYEVPAVLSLYENGQEQFCNACGVRLKGWTSMKLPKKSLGVYFRGIYGDGDVHCDLFHNGITDYSSLSIRAGQDYTFAVVRNELMQNLCAEASSNLLTQNYKYCALYINGEYWGLYCLKENINEDYFASQTGVKSDSVYTTKGPVALSTELNDLIEFTWYHDMSDPENYEYFTSRFDIDSLIDWVILEGYSCNSDTVSNIRYFKSPEYKDGKYVLCFFDLDWALWYNIYCFDNIFAGGGNSGYQVQAMMLALIENNDFRDRFLMRFSELINTTLSTEHVMAEFERLITLVEPEVLHDRNKWDMTVSGFYTRVEEVRTFLTSGNYEEFCTDRVCKFLHVSKEEREYYFPSENKTVQPNT